MNKNRDLFKEVIDFATSDRFEREVRKAKKEYFLRGGEEIKELVDAIPFFHWYIFDRPNSKTGKTPLIMYIEEHQMLFDKDKTRLQKLEDNILSRFVIKEIKDDGVVLRELHSNRRYLVRERTALPNLSKDLVIHARIFPWDDHYVFSGCLQPYPFKVKSTKRGMRLVDMDKIHKLLEKGFRLLDEKNYDRAIDIANRVLKADESNEDALLLKGEALYH